MPTNITITKRRTPTERRRLQGMSKQEFIRHHVAGLAAYVESCRAGELESVGDEAIKEDS